MGGGLGRDFLVLGGSKFGTGTGATGRLGKTMSESPGAVDTLLVIAGASGTISSAVFFAIFGEEFEEEEAEDGRDEGREEGRDEGGVPVSPRKYRVIFELAEDEESCDDVEKRVDGSWFGVSGISGNSNCEFDLDPNFREDL